MEFLGTMIFSILLLLFLGCDEMCNLDFLKTYENNVLVMLSCGIFCLYFFPVN